MSSEGAIDDRYRLLELIGEGGAGHVHRAVDRRTGEVVALKLLRDLSPRSLERFAREARILAEVGHPHVVRYVAQGVTAAGGPYLAMEWLEGESLAARLARGALGIGESVALGRCLAGALAAAHARGVIHRDVKPSNVFLVNGALTDPRVLDFGTAYASEGTTADEEALTRTGTALGTPGYMAPEQARGDRARIDARADVFSLGAVLFQCLTGRRAFPGEHVMAVLAQLLLGEAPRVRELRPEVPEALDALVSRLLARDPAQRPADGAAAARELEALGPLTPGEEAPSVRPGGAAITGDQQRLLAVVSVSFASPPREEELARARTVATLLGARVDDTALGLAATLTGPESATDLAARAARCALRLQAAVPGVALAVSMGHAQSSQEIALGPARAGAPARIDELTRALLDERFDVQADGRGGFALVAEREVGETARRLLGRPSPYVGRERELRMLGDLIAQTFDGDRGAQAVAVTAPAGMGKTRLRHELTRSLRAARPNLAIAVGRADAMSAGSTFVVIGSLLRTSMFLTPGEAPAMARAKVRAWIARLVPPAERQRVTVFLGEIMGTPFDDEDEEGHLLAARQSAARMAAEITRAFVDGLRGLCAQRPALILLEDLHWADDASIQLVDQALRDLEDEPLVVLALARPEVHERFPALWSKRGLQGIRLGALPRRAAEELVSLSLDAPGAPVPPADLARLCDQAAGNAFYLEELIRAYAAGGREGLPETVLGMVEARLEAVPAAPRRLLRAASVFGEVFPAAGALALLGEGDHDDAGRDGGRWLQWLIDREILVRRPGTGGEDEHAFRHALLREGSYAMLTERDRVLGHRLAGHWLGASGGDHPLTPDEARAAVIGEHFFRGEEWGEAFTWFARAGEAASRLHANVEARLHYGRALAALERDADGDEVRRRRVDTMIRKAEISYGDDPARNLEMLAAAEAIAAALPAAAEPPSADYRRLAVVHYWMGRSHWYLNAYGQALGYYRRVLVAASLLGDDELAALPNGTIGRVMLSQGHFGRCRAFFEKTFTTLERQDGWVEWILNTGNMAMSAAARGHAAEGEALAERGLRRARELGSPTSLSITHTQLGTVLFFSGEVPRALALFRDAARIAEQAGDPVYAFLAHALATWASARLGDHAAAAASGARASAIMTEMGRRLFYADWFDGILIESAARAGRSAEAIAAAERDVPHLQASGNIFAEAVALRGWGMALAATGALAEAAGNLRESLRLLTAGEAVMEAARTRVELALVERRLGDDGAADEHLAAAAQVLRATEIEAALYRGSVWVSAPR